MPPGYLPASELPSDHRLWCPKGSFLKLILMKNDDLGINFPNYRRGCPEGWEGAHFFG
jgi:hypothetical protein